MTDQTIGRIAAPFSEFDDLARERMRGLDPRGEETRRAEAVEYGESLEVVADPDIQQRLGLRQGRDRLGRIIPAQRQQRIRPRELQREFQRAAFRIVR